MTKIILLVVAQLTFYPLFVGLVTYYIVSSLLTNISDQHA